MENLMKHFLSLMGLVLMSSAAVAGGPAITYDCSLVHLKTKKKLESEAPIQVGQKRVVVEFKAFATPLVSAIRYRLTEFFSVEVLNRVGQVVVRSSVPAGQKSHLELPLAGLVSDCGPTPSVDFLT